MHIKNDKIFKKFRRILIITMIISIEVDEAARILAVFPCPFLSHQIFFRPITKELAKSGHQVVVVTTDREFTEGQTPENLTEIDVHNITYTTWRNNVMKANVYHSDIASVISTAAAAYVRIAEQHFEAGIIKKLLEEHREPFDVAIIEASLKSAYIYAHILGDIPTIQISSFGAISEYEMVGAPLHPVYFPGIFSDRRYNLTVFETMKQTYTDFKLSQVYKRERAYGDEMTKKFLPNAPSINRLCDDVVMLFLNVHSMWEDNRPVPPGVIYINGVYTKPEKPLPKDLQTYLDSSENGVIYVSFGSNVKPSVLSPEKVNILISTLSQLPYEILLKWDREELPVKTKNIKILKWLPQTDILRHPKVKLFITQGGMQSTEEAINAGVPLIAIPLLFDQRSNAERYVKYGIGKYVDIETLAEDKLRDAIETIIKDDSYRSNIVKFRSLIHDQPQKALDKVLWWTEYVVRHRGAKHLKSPAANTPLAEYLELELLLLVFTTIIVIISLLVLLVRRFCKFILNLTR